MSTVGFAGRRGSPAPTAGIPSAEQAFTQRGGGILLAFLRSMKDPTLTLSNAGSVFTGVFSFLGHSFAGLDTPIQLPAADRTGNPAAVVFNQNGFTLISRGTGNFTLQRGSTDIEAIAGGTQYPVTRVHMPTQQEVEFHYNDASGADGVVVVRVARPS